MQPHTRSRPPAPLSIAPLALSVAAALSAPTMAEIIAVAGGHIAPPMDLGPYDMTSFELDDRPLYEWVTDVPSPLGGTVDFSVPLQHRRIGDGWKFWGHGYEGDVYSSYGSGYEVTMNLPDQTMAFYFYATHFLTQTTDIYAVADDGTAIWQDTDWGSGAVYFGFYQDDPAGPPIKHITVSCYHAGMVAVGEFGIAIPGAGPGMLAMLAIAGLGARLRRRWQ